MQLNPGFRNERLMSQPKEILCCVTSMHHSAFGLSTLQRCHWLCKVYTLLDGSVLWIHIVTPMLETFWKSSKHTSPGKGGFCQAYTLFSEGSMCVSPIAQLLSWSRVGLSSFAAQLPSSQDEGESKPGCLAICMLLLTLTWDDQR